MEATGLTLKWREGTSLLVASLIHALNPPNRCRYQLWLCAGYQSQGLLGRFALILSSLLQELYASAILAPVHF